MRFTVFFIHDKSTFSFFMANQVKTIFPLCLHVVKHLVRFHEKHGGRKRVRRMHGSKADGKVVHDTLHLDVRVPSF